MGEEKPSRRLEFFSPHQKKSILHYCIIATKMNAVKRVVGRKQNKNDRKNARREQIETNLENKRNRSGEKKESACTYMNMCAASKKKGKNETHTLRRAPRDRRDDEMILLLYLSPLRDTGRRKRSPLQVPLLITVALPRLLTLSFQQREVASPLSLNLITLSCSFGARLKELLCSNLLGAQISVPSTTQSMKTIQWLVQLLLSMISIMNCCPLFN